MACIHHSGRHCHRHHVRPVHPGREKFVATFSYFVVGALIIVIFMI
jgi:hypothetical protein